jgi:hypothetical protein
VILQIGHHAEGATMTATDLTLAQRIENVTALALTPGAEVYLDPADVDFEAWNHVGDPLCEALITVMRARKLMGGDLYANARSLEAEGLPEAVAFFADVEAVPSWLDVDALRVGASMGRRHPIGLIFGMHGGLPFTYIDPSTAEVMAATGRLGRGGYARRFWETGVGFVGALDVDGMMPGGDRWVEWVRIRFLHTMIRLGIHRSGRWPLYDTATPISQVASAATPYIFGQYRVNIIEAFGGFASPEEREGFALMWRWVARIEGSNNQLLGRTHAEEFELQRLNHAFLYGGSDKAVALTRDLIAGTGGMTIFGRSKRLNAAVVRRLLAPSMIATLPDHDVRELLGVRPHLVADSFVSAAAFALKGAGLVARLEPIRRLADRRGQDFLDRLVERQLKGIKADFRETPVHGDPAAA